MKLKPCPYCDSEAIVFPFRNGYVVECCNCGMCLGDEEKEDDTGCFEPFYSKTAAINAWNAEVSRWVS